MGETLTVTRGVTDKVGNRVTTSTHAIGGAVAWGTWSRNPNERGESSKGSAELYAVKGVDLRKRDRVSRQDGQTFAVISDAMWEGLHPITGQDFGMVVYQLEAVNG
ncbi:hypothetical protein BH10ACT9_BH10ACT9_28440 [soil metagenome]